MCNNPVPHSREHTQARGQFCQRIPSCKRTRSKIRSDEYHGQGEIGDYSKGMWSGFDGLTD